jgi:hypothetical protein
MENKTLMKYKNIREEELKNKVAQDYFWIYDCTKIMGNVDFCVGMHQSHTELFEQESLLWAEAKKGVSNIYNSIAQLILTIGKARTFDKFLPPPFLGAFDGEKIAFLPYNDIHDIFYINDFNWNVTPSNYETKEFQLILNKVCDSIDKNSLLFYFIQDDNELQKFIKSNFVVGKFGISKTKIDKNNFMIIYNKWLQNVKPTIAVNWEIVKKSGIIDGDFYLADLLSIENESIKEKLFVLLKKDYYELDRKLSESGLFSSSTTGFKDNLKAHTQFWNKYERPPKEEYWDYIVERRDLLVPQDVRERKGSFFTPQIWVELSQKYLTEVLGDDWQDEYYVWDCAAGTGNLLNGLTNKYNIWASTLDKQDVEVMKDRIKNGANLLEDHVFQFDFLNDDFDKLPKPLKAIIDDEEKRKKLVIYINPPYAESNGRISTNRSHVQITKIHTKYADKLEKLAPELFAQFLTRIYFEIPNSIIAQFSTLKALSSTNSTKFRDFFKAKLMKLFVMPSFTFDNVKGKFPIGFFIWDTKKKEIFKKIKSDVYNLEGSLVNKKNFYSYDNLNGRINEWLNVYKQKEKYQSNIGYLMADAPDFQNNNFISIQNHKAKRHGINFILDFENLLIASIYFAVRHCKEATWLNDRDQFLYPNKKWEIDMEFQNDCLAFTLFHGQNKITSTESTNHWIPFTEYEVGAREKFDSNFMTDFIRGRLKPNMVQEDLFGKKESSANRNYELVFSNDAKAVFMAGKKLWQYFHQQPNCNVNASLYDIREHFQGRNDKGKMNNKSNDETYMDFIVQLRDALKVLAQKIEPKVYEYEFLRL